MKWMLISFVLGGLAFWHFYGKDRATAVDLEHVKSDMAVVGGAAQAVGEHLWEDVEKMAPGDKVAALRERLCTSEVQSEVDCVARIKQALAAGQASVRQGVEAVGDKINALKDDKATAASDEP